MLIEQLCVIFNLGIMSIKWRAYSDTLLTFMEVVVILDTLVLERVDVMQQFFIMEIKIHLTRKSYMTVIYVASIWALNTIAI
uniref:Uncharacterized protein n=1 Tax=Acrobeloides nanus TaxID=290746 RepID=A0A914DDP8_9BILA